MMLHSSLVQYCPSKFLVVRAVSEIACAQKVCLITDWHELSRDDDMVGKLESWITGLYSAVRVLTSEPSILNASYGEKPFT